MGFLFIIIRDDDIIILLLLLLKWFIIIVLIISAWFFIVINEAATCFSLSCCSLIIIIIIIQFHFFLDLKKTHNAAVHLTCFLTFNYLVPKYQRQYWPKCHFVNTLDWSVLLFIIGQIQLLTWSISYHQILFNLSICEINLLTFR